MKNVMKELIKEQKFVCNNYNTIPRVMVRGKGIYVFDKNSYSYIDCISGYSALNQGHCHNRLINVVHKQIQNLTLTSRAYHNDKLGIYSEKLCKLFNYNKVLLMNGGVESGESAIKIARSWGYKNKKIPKYKAVNIFFKNNFWGRSLAACSSSDDPSCYNNFGPFNNGMQIIEYDNIEKLKKCLESNHNIVSVMLEPIQGEGGIIIPSVGYLHKVRELCTQYNVLMIADEVQTGLGRTGKLLACDYEKVRPDILCLGKSLSGGFYPISAVLCDNHIMDVITPGVHGSTYGGNPLACAIGIEALNIIKDENLIKNSYLNGNIFRNVIKSYDYEFIKVRGRGLLNGIEFENKKMADKFVSELLNHRVLVKSTRDNIIRITPPLVISQKQMTYLLDKIINVLNKM